MSHLAKRLIIVIVLLCGSAAAQQPHTLTGDIRLHKNFHSKILNKRALPFLFQSILGFRCAPPQALCCRPLRGLNRKLYQLDQTFFSLNLLFDGHLVRHLISTLRARPSSAIVTTFN